MVVLWIGGTIDRGRKKAITMKGFEELCREYLEKHVLFEEDRCFVAGGFFPRFYHNMPIRDIDVYVNDDKYFQKLYGLYSDMGFLIDRESSDFVSFLHPNPTDHTPNIDLIAFHQPRSVDIVDSFDFNICKGWMTEDKQDIPLYAISSKKMKFESKSLDANFGCYVKENNSLTRLIRYVNLGFTMSDYELGLMYQAMLDYTKKEEKKGILKRWIKS
jgi:hypothetical protein